MACSIWNEEGMLYCTGELAPENMRRFEDHIAQCDKCRRELAAYRRESETLYSESMLGETPSKKTDERIKKWCLGKRCLPVGGMLFPMMIRKGAISIGFLVLGVALGTISVFYVRNRVSPSPGPGRASLDMPSPAAVRQPADSIAMAQASADSLPADSSETARIGKVGDADTRGMIAVDVEKP